MPAAEKGHLDVLRCLKASVSVWYGTVLQSQSLLPQPLQSFPMTSLSSQSTVIDIT